MFSADEARKQSADNMQRKIQEKLQEILKEGDVEDRSYEDFLSEWKQYVDEATHTAPIQYSGDALTIDDAIDNLVCDIDEEKEIDVALIHQLIKLRDKLTNEKQV